MTQRLIFRDLKEMARHFEKLAKTYQRQKPRSKMDEVFNKGQMSALFSVAETIKVSEIDPTIGEPPLDAA